MYNNSNFLFILNFKIQLYVTEKNIFTASKRNEVYAIRHVHMK
jgi:hypothetical protein